MEEIKSMKDLLDWTWQGYQIGQACATARESFDGAVESSIRFAVSNPSRCNCYQGQGDSGEAGLKNLGGAEIELIAEKVHKAYCDNYKQRKDEPYWTNGDYSKLDDETKEIDRATVRAVLKAIKELVG
jgi:hypothetical protein